jgi:hypothetical protein
LGYDFKYSETFNPADALNIACYETRLEIGIYTAVKLERITAIVGHNNGYGGLLAYHLNSDGEFVGGTDAACEEHFDYINTFSLKLAKIYDMSATYGGSLYISISQPNNPITFTLEMGTILESTAEYFGGGIYFSGENYLVIRNVNFTLCVAKSNDGGGIYMDSCKNDKPLKFESLTFKECSAGRSGGAIFVKF